MGRTTTLDKIENLYFEPTFYKVVQGGMSAGKTYAILTLLIGYCESFTDKLVTVVGLSYKHLAGGALRDFEKIMKAQKRWNDMSFNKTSSTYTFKTGSKIEFLAIDKMTAHGLRRDVLYVNEANGIDWATFDQLASRTHECVFVDFNPTAKFWAHEQLVEGRFKERTSFLIVNYKDNEALDEREIESIESHAPRAGEEPSNWWTVYGLGQIGSLEGNIYQGWIEVPEYEITDNGKLIRYGLDFGFTNDETGLVSLYEMPDGRLGIVEKLYKSGILGSQYCATLKNIGIDGSTIIVADSARPEIIAEIRRGGFRCIPADKNAGSVKRGIDRVQQQQIIYSGTNLKREFLSYAWRKTRTGQTIDEPCDGNDHLLDALRYAVDDLFKPRFDF